MADFIEFNIQIEMNGISACSAQPSEFLTTLIQSLQTSPSFDRHWGLRTLTIDSNGLQRRACKKSMMLILSARVRVSY